MSASKAIGALVALVSTTCFAVDAAAQSTWYVDGGNCPGPGAGSQADPFCTIQAGLDAGQTGDTVLVADGTYTGPGNRDMSFPTGRNFTLRSKNGPENCVIVGEALSVVPAFRFVSETAEAFVDGFTFTSLGSGVETIYFQGDTRATLANCVFFGIESNVCILCFESSRPTIIDCTITGNEAGGIRVENDSFGPTIINCTITNNTAGGAGGGVLFTSLLDSSPTIINSTITGNTAFSNGGGIAIEGFSSPTVINCTISGNMAKHNNGGIFTEGFGSPTVINSIIWGNGGFKGAPGSQVDGTGITVTYSDVQGGFPGTGNIDADPRFVDPANGDYRLGPGSPAIDSGDTTAVPAGVTTDLDGNPRLRDDPGVLDSGNPDGVNPIVDMGAYEFQGATPPIPTVSEWGVVVMILLTLTAGTLILKSRVPVQAIH